VDKCSIYVQNKKSATSVFF